MQFRWPCYFDIDSDSDFWFTVVHKRSYNSDYNFDSVASVKTSFRVSILWLTISRMLVWQNGVQNFCACKQPNKCICKRDSKFFKSLLSRKWKFFRTKLPRVVSAYFATITDVTLHICCCHDDVLTEEKLRKRRFSNKYHGVLHHTAHALSGMLSYLEFRLDRRKTIHYTTSGLKFFKYLSSESISVFKKY